MHRDFLSQQFQARWYSSNRWSTRTEYSHRLNAWLSEQSLYWTVQGAKLLVEVKVNSSRFRKILVVTDTRPQENVEGRIDGYGLWPTVLV